MVITRKRLFCLLAALLTTGFLAVQQASAASVAAERYVGRLNIANWSTSELTLHMYGVYSIGGTGAMFNPAVIPASAKQLVIPYIRVADGNLHRYRLDCQVTGGGPTGTTTDYQLTNMEGTVTQTSTQPQGAVTVSFQVAVDLEGPGARYWTLSNASGHLWVFSACDVYELLP